MCQKLPAERPEYQVRPDHIQVLRPITLVLVYYIIFRRHGKPLFVLHVSVHHGIAEASKHKFIIMLLRPIVLVFGTKCGPTTSRCRVLRTNTHTDLSLYIYIYIYMYMSICVYISLSLYIYIYLFIYL